MIFSIIIYKERLRIIETYGYLSIFHSKFTSISRVMFIRLTGHKRNISISVDNDNDDNNNNTLVIDKMYEVIKTKMYDMVDELNDS